MMEIMRSSATGAVERAAAGLARARRVLAITGAGLSADSGLPTYRGVGGLYGDQVTDDGVAIEQALSGAMFARDPALTWKYLAQIESAARGACPNAGHRALARMSDCFERLYVLTQNVDGLHRAAGSRDLIEIHGNIHRLYCVGCRRSERVQDFAHLDDPWPPRCRHCGGVRRPAVVLFGETLPAAALADYEAAMQDDIDAVLVIGTSAVFEYIAAPVAAARRRGCTTIEINPVATSVSGLCTIRCRGRAAELLPAMERGLHARRQGAMACRARPLPD